MTELAHILVVDDDPSFQHMFRVLLNDTGYRVSVAKSGEEALAYMDLVTPDLVLMDLILPGVSGQQVTERIKANISKPFIPVILVTAKNDQRAKVTALDAGADDFLVKPVEFPELLARVRAMLRLQRSQRSLRAEQRKTELLLHLTRELGTTLDLDKLLTQFLDRLADAVGASRASIVLTTDEPPRLYSSQPNSAHMISTETLRTGIAGWVLHARSPIIIAETRQDQRWNASNTPNHMVRSAAAVPITREDRILGVITLVHHTPGYFTDEHLDLLNSVAAQSAVALENAELFQLTRRQNTLLERRTEELQRLNQASRLLAELMHPEQLLQLVTYLVHVTFGYQSVSILLKDHEDLVVQAVAGGFDTEKRMYQRYPIGQGMLGEAALQPDPIYLSDIRQDARYNPSEEHEQFRSRLIIPIVTAHEIFGVLHVESIDIDAFGPNDSRLLGTLCGQLAVALQNARLYREVADERSTLNAVLGGAADPILLISSDNRLLLANRAAHEHLGIRSDSSVSDSISDLIAHPELQRVLSSTNDASEQPALIEVVMPSGTTFSVSVAPVHSADHNQIGRVTVLQDITAIKELERREQERLRSVFRRYVSPQVVEEVLAGGADIGAPVERNVAVIVADLRGYTALTEGLEPRILVEHVLNRYFTAMTSVLHHHGGTIDKFLGDGIIGVFGSPIAHSDDLQRILLAAVDLQRAFSELRAAWRSELRRDIGMGIGIDYGRAVVGNIGSEQRLDYTLIGDVVNTATRLTGIARAGQIIVSTHLIAALPPHWRTPWPLRRLNHVHLKGKHDPLLIYEIEYDAIKYDAVTPN